MARAFEKRFRTICVSKHPQIAAIKETLYDMGAIYASMSGSGSAVYGIFNRPVPEVRKVFSDCFTFEKELRR